MKAHGGKKKKKLQIRRKDVRGSDTFAKGGGNANRVRLIMGGKNLQRKRRITMGR